MIVGGGEGVGILPKRIVYEQKKTNRQKLDLSHSCKNTRVRKDMTETVKLKGTRIVCALLNSEPSGHKS